MKLLIDAHVTVDTLIVSVTYLLIYLLTRRQQALRFDLIEIADAFREPKMRKNSTAAGALPRTLLGESTAFPQAP